MEETTPTLVVKVQVGSSSHSSYNEPQHNHKAKAWERIASYSHTHSQYTVKFSEKIGFLPKEQLQDNSTESMQKLYLENWILYQKKMIVWMQMPWLLNENKL